MTHVICRLTAKNWDQLRNPTLGNRVWATFLHIQNPEVRCAYVTPPSTALGLMLLAADACLLVLVLVVDERGSFSAIDAHIFPCLVQTVLEDVD